MATFEELKTGLETAFDSDGSKGIEATIQINIEDLTNFYVDINDGVGVVRANEQRFVLTFREWFVEIGGENKRPGRFFDVMTVSL